MIDNTENFDNICINSQDGDIDGELMSNCNNTAPRTYINTKKSFETTNLEKIINDESSNDSDETEFIRQISKPLLNTGKSESRLRKRLHLQHKRKSAKLISSCFLVSLSCGILVTVIFVLLPNRTLQYWHDALWRLYTMTEGRYKYVEGGSIIGCDHITVEHVWARSFPLMLTEGALRLLRVNDDDVLDIVVPFGTNVQEKIACKIYFPGQERCFGGLLALDGRTGEILWRYDAIGEMYALVCLEDLNKDGYIDCLGSGRHGTFAAVNGRDGSELWAFDSSRERNGFMNLYTSQFIEDIDRDGVRDIVQIHGGDPVADPTEMNRLKAKLIIFSGRTGKVLVSTIMPDNYESYYSPQLMNLGDGKRMILFGTGGETFPGSLFETDLNQLIHSVGGKSQRIKARKLYEGKQKGVMCPPVLVDLNGDGREDIVMCPFSDECFAIDGVSFKQIWKFRPSKPFETYATPAAGYYNNDAVPDIFIQIFIGLGYPVYFYGETLILDGKTGKLLKNLTRSNNAVMTSPLTLSMEGYGNDMFLFWVQLCRGHENDVNETPFQNLPQYILSRANFCKVRFNTTAMSLFLIHGKHVANPSSPYRQIYNSENNYDIEHSNMSNTSEKIEKFLHRHPAYRPIYEKYVDRLETTDLSNADANYAHNKDGYHDSIVEGQNRLGDINLDDSVIHKLIDFNKASTEEDIGPEEYVRDESRQYDERGKPSRVVRSSKEMFLHRYRRHNGPHDGEGVQRLISTGTLAPPLLNINDKYFNHSMDIIFSTYWSIPKEIVLQTKLEIKCNTKWEHMEPQRFKNTSKFFHYDHDHYTKYGNIYCAKKYGRKVPLSNDRKQSTIFNTHFGQLTTYRKRLRCTCSPGRVLENQRCGRILPFHLQTWPAYLGLGGTAYWNSSTLNLKMMKEM